MALSLHGLFLWIAVCPSEAGRIPAKCFRHNRFPAAWHLAVCSQVPQIGPLSSSAPRGQRLTEYWFPPMIPWQVNMAQPHDQLRHSWVRNAFLLGFCPCKLPWSETSGFPAIASTVSLHQEQVCLFYVTSPFNSRSQPTAYPQEHMT